MLATLDISKALDEHGNAVEPQIVFDNMAFRCVRDALGSTPLTDEAGLEQDTE